MKLSIIVPVYGVEKYIIEFAKSLIYQLTKDVELIIVNDGTKDNSIILLKEFFEVNDFETNNIVWLEQENQGQSVARNYGIALAKGEYITFLDPDDYVISDYISIILENIIKDSVDLYQFNAEIMRNGKVCGSLDLVDDANVVIVEPSKVKEIIKKKMWFSWLRVVKREFLEEEFFPKGVNFQDMMAFPSLYKRIKIIKNINKRLVIYRVHHESSVNNFKPSEKMIFSAEYGLGLYESSHDEIGMLIYIQFVELCMDYQLRKNGLIASIKWLVRRVFLNRASSLYFNILKLIQFCFKITLIATYRIVKGVK